MTEVAGAASTVGPWLVTVTQEGAVKPATGVASSAVLLGVRRGAR